MIYRDISFVENGCSRSKLEENYANLTFRSGLKVVWETIVDDDKGVTLRNVREETGYNLPVRCVFAGMNRHDAAEWIANELRRRSGEL